MKKIIVISNGDLSPALLAARSFYETRKENGVCPDIICMSKRKSLFSWRSDAEKVKEILITLGVSDFRIQTKEETTLQDCILYSLHNDVSECIWCVPAGTSILIRRLALKQGMELIPKQILEDWQVSLSLRKKERKKEIRQFSLRLIAEKLVGLGDTILGRCLSTDIIWTDGRPTFAMPVPPYGLQ